jgi:Mce-associated membrane protein
MTESATSAERAEPDGKVILEKTAGAEDVGQVAPEATSTGSTEPVPNPKRGRRARRAAAKARAAASAPEAGSAPDAGSTPEVGDADDKASGEESKPGRFTLRRRPRDTSEPRGTPVPALVRVIPALLALAGLLAAILLVQVIKGPGSYGKAEARENRSEAARQQAETAIPRLFSFDYRTLDKDFAAQQALTTGDFTNKVKTQTGPAVQAVAPKIHVVIQGVALDAAVTDDSGPDVKVLVFLNQAVTSDLLAAPRLDRNRVLATMRLVNGQWKVADVQAL